MKKNALLFAPIGIMAVFVCAMAQDVPSRPAGVTTDSERAVARGIEFLANAQAKDGSWRNMGGRGSYPTAMTSLAGLALISAGNTPTRGKYALHLRRGIGFILGSSQRNGLITDFQSEARPMYGHGFSMLFLSQVYGMEEDRQRRDEIRKVLRRGVELIARSQSAQGGWNYSPDSGGDEGSVTIMQVQGLRGCRNVGIKVPKEVIDGAIRYIENSTTSDGGISYRVGQGGSRPSLAAPAAACLYNAGKYDSPLAERILKYCDSHLSADGPRGRGATTTTRNSTLPRLTIRPEESDGRSTTRKSRSGSSTARGMTVPGKATTSARPMARRSPSSSFSSPTRTFPFASAEHPWRRDCAPFPVQV